MLELPNGLKECLEFLLLFWSLLFHTEASESSRASMTRVGEPLASLWRAELASAPWLGHGGIPVFLTHGCQREPL